MVTQKQKKASRLNIRAALRKWISMTHRQRALAQPEGRARKKPGTTGKGKFYRIIVRPKSEFSSFRNQDVGKKGHIERLAGRRKSGSWDTHSWLIAKTDAEVKDGNLIGKTKDAKKIISQLSTKPKKVKGDIFQAKPRKNIPERLKPTKKMKAAQKKNIRKAQATRRKSLKKKKQNNRKK